MMRYHLYGKNRRVFLEGLQRYRDRGVIIRIDGKEAEESEWIKLLEVQKDGSFYMGDYIMDDHISPEAEITEETVSMVCENTVLYDAVPEAENGSPGGTEEDITCEKNPQVRTLKEIRFDRVYHR